MKIDVEQARKRAKELVKAGAAEQLADAQRVVARELGYPSWPAMIHALEPPTAERVIREADHRPDLALELLAEAPALREDPWVRLTLGDASGIATLGPRADRSRSAALLRRTQPRRSSTACLPRAT